MTDTTKSDCDKGPFTLDWTDFFNKIGLDPLVSPITKSTWVVISGTGTIGADFITTPKTTVFSPGGVTGETYVLENTIEVDNGTFCDCHKLFITVT